MSDLSHSEKRKLEEFLGMKSGWVLAYSNRTFTDLVRDTTGRDIFDERYKRDSGSKASRLRAFWSIEDNATVGALLREMVDFACDGVRTGKLAEDCRAIVTRLQSNAAASPPNATTTVAKAPTDPQQYAMLGTGLQDLFQLPPSPRGFAFERFLDDVFAVFDLSPRKSFRLVGEQIDGSFHLAHETYLVEAKWQDAKIGNRDLQSFAGTVRSKSSWARGLYISYSGFTDEGLTAFSRGDATRIICLDGLELWQIIQHQLNLAEVLLLKTRRAAETGRAYFPVRELFPNLT